jgi:translation initiation factor IF-3
MLKLIISVEEFGVPEGMPKMEGKKMIGMVKPKVQK